eukprot:evm.model.scf_427.4 EVM.evm.TU.scf_427.4   scf_427:16887-17396(-)
MEVAAEAMEVGGTVAAVGTTDTRTRGRMDAAKGVGCGELRHKRGILGRCCLGKITPGTGPPVRGDVVGEWGKAGLGCGPAVRDLDTGGSAWDGTLCVGSGSVCCLLEGWFPGFGLGAAVFELLWDLCTVGERSSNAGHHSQIQDHWIVLLPVADCNRRPCWNEHLDVTV